METQKHSIRCMQSIKCVSVQIHLPLWCDVEVSSVHTHTDVELLLFLFVLNLQKIQLFLVLSQGRHIQVRHYFCRNIYPNPNIKKHHNSECLLSEMTSCGWSSLFFLLSQGRHIQVRHYFCHNIWLFWLQIQ